MVTVIKVVDAEGRTYAVVTTTPAILLRLRVFNWWGLRRLQQSVH